MKDEIIEEEIVHYFFKKNKRDRILWELKSPKKRDEFFWRLSGANNFKDDCLKSAPYMPFVELKEKLTQMGGASSVYYMGESHIGKLPIDEAVSKVLAGERCIVYCGNGMGFYQGEWECGTPRFFLLANESKR